MTHSDNSSFYDFEKKPAFFYPFRIHMVGETVTEYFMSHPNIKKFLQSDQRFDAVIVQQFISDGIKLFAHHFKAPLILFSNLGSNVRISMFNGVPEPPSYLPDVFLNYGTEMTFIQRTHNLLMRILQYSVFHFLSYSNQNDIMKRYLPDSPELHTILYNISLVLVNSHESFEHPRPYVPNMVNVGGFHISHPKDLPEDLKNIMDNAKEGVIYFSMGSHVVPSRMPPKIQNAIVKVLGSRKEQVLWKWDQEELKNKPPNVMISKWFPQQDILAHPKLKLFITHCGLSSITEAIYDGVPILGFPIFGDQKLNCKRATVLGFGKSLAFSKIAEKDLGRAINEILDNPKYKETAKHRSQVFHDRPIKPTDLIGYWVKYVIRHKGAPHLRVAGTDLPWYQYFMLDVVAAFIGAAFLLLVIFMRLVKFSCSKKNLKPKLKKN